MAVTRQLEVIHPNGKVEFYVLDPERGTTTIGCHPSNDIVLAAPGVVPFHAMVDHRQEPFELVALSAPHLPQVLAPWERVDLAGHALVVVDALAASPTFSPPPPAVSAPRLGVRFSLAEWTIEVAQTAQYEVMLINEGAEPLVCDLHVEGIDPAWLAFAPGAGVMLEVGERRSITVAITPPRHASSRAGEHTFTLFLTLPDHPGWRRQATGSLRILPFYDFAIGSPEPKQQSLSSFRRSGEVRLPLSNRGNSEAHFRLEGSEEEQGCHVGFQLPGERTPPSGHLELGVPPGESVLLPVRITPYRRPHLMMEKQRYHFRLTATLLGENSRARTVAGQLEQRSFIGFGLVTTVTLCLAVMGTLFFQHLRPATSTAQSLAAALPKRHAPLRYGLPAMPPETALEPPLAPQPVLDVPAPAMTYEEMFKEIAPRYGLEWRLLAAVAYRESTLNPQALGKSGDMGLMQIMPATWDEMAPQVGVSDPYDAYSNALVGAAFLAEMRAYFTRIGYPQDKWMLLAYNWGPNNLRLLLQSEGGWVGWSKVPLAKQRYAMGILQLASDTSASWWREEMLQPVPRTSTP